MESADEEFKFWPNITTEPVPPISCWAISCKIEVPLDGPNFHIKDAKQMPNAYIYLQEANDVCNELLKREYEHHIFLQEFLELHKVKFDETKDTVGRQPLEEWENRLSLVDGGAVTTNTGKITIQVIEEEVPKELIENPIQANQMLLKANLRTDKRKDVEWVEHEERFSETLANIGLENGPYEWKGEFLEQQRRHKIRKIHYAKERKVLAQQLEAFEKKREEEEEAKLQQQFKLSDWIKPEYLTDE
jgi:hypothetical protein